MSLTNWIASQSGGIKLLMSLGLGIFVYVCLRFFIHLGNKSWKEQQAKIKHKPTREETLRVLSSE